MKRLALLGVALIFNEVMSHDPFTCAVKTVALERSGRILRGRHCERVRDALDFVGSGCSVPALPAKVLPTQHTEFQSPLILHVNPTLGDDDNAGSEANPLQSLHEAQLRLRALPITKRGGATVILEAGTHFMNKPLVFTSADSGTAESPVMWKGKRAVVSGGRLLDCRGKWQLVDSKLRVYRCKVESEHEFESLFIGGLRQVRARYPNGSPLMPKEGYASGCKTMSSKSPGKAFVKNMKVLGADGEKTLSTLCVFPQDRNSSIIVKDTLQPRTVDAVKKHKEMDQTQYAGTYFNETYNYPFWLSSAPTSILLPPSVQGRQWSATAGAVVKMMHPAGWASWAFEVSSHNASSGSFEFSKGGFQEARGLPASLPDACGDMYVENLREELDMPGEWWMDVLDGWLYYIPMHDWTDMDLQQAEVIVPQLQQLIEFRGSQHSSAQHIHLEGFNISHTAPTYLESYEVPSGGDWSIHRGAAVFLDGAEHVQLKNLFFDQVDGNGVFLSNHAARNTVQDCDFWRTGDTAIAVVGSVPLGDARKGFGATWPVGNALIGNWIEEVGVNMKQTGCIFQSLAESTVISSNVCYNGPRAGVTLNDGFVGGSVVEGNVIFNMVRETGDHGTINSWDRREFLLPCKDGDGACFTPQTIHVRHNMFLGPAGWNVDHDDGSSQYEDFSNVVFLGTIKFRDGVMRNMTRNLMVQSFPAFQVTGFETNFWVNNTIASNSTVKVCAPSSTAALTGTRYLSLAEGQEEETEPARQCWIEPCICDQGTVLRVTARQLQQIIRETVEILPHAGEEAMTVLI